MTDHMKDLCEKFKNRNLLEELSWTANYPPKGYVNKANTDYYQWLAYMAYQTIKDGDGDAP